MKRFYTMGIIFFIVIAVTSCVGSRATVRSSDLNNMKYPVSMSAFLYRKNNEVLVKGRDLQVVGAFSYKARTLGFLYSSINFGKPDRLADEVNKQVNKAGGDGIVNFAAIASSDPTSHWLRGWPGIGMLPTSSAATDMIFTGEIVKAQRRSE